MTRTSAIVVVVVGGLLLALVACKGKEVIKPDPQTEKALKDCNDGKGEKDKLIAALQEENAKLMANKGGELVVTIEGADIKVRGSANGGGGGGAPVDDKATAAAAKEFLDVVAKSRGEIQKCYEQALKKNSGLQAKSVTLVVQASFAPSGAFKNSSFSPLLGEPFDGCMKRVSTRWALSQSSPAMTFKAPVSLTPS